MRFGLIANLHRKGAKETIKTFINWTEKNKQELVISENLSNAIFGSFNFLKESELAQHSDVVVSMGGDGTLLSTARLVGKRAVKLLGVNLGSLGFLTQITPAELPGCLDRVLKNNYEIQKRMVLEASFTGDHQEQYALNEVVVDNRPLGRMIDVSLRVNSEDILTYRCDGLIIATPTGSTGYSLSVGGPIIHPSMEAIIAAPISAFSLSTRPMILRSTDVLELAVVPEHKTAALTLDGQVTRELRGGDTVLVKHAGFMHQFIVFPETSFYKVCRNKLHWGVTPTGESE